MNPAIPRRATSAFLLLLGAVAACASGPDGSVAPIEPTAEHTHPPPRRLRVGNQHWLRRARDQEEFLSPLIYSNHMPKSFAFETLVRTDARGRPLPGLANSWESSPDRRTWTFDLRPGARFHDGAPCDAPAVVRYFESWLVAEQDRFVGACERIESVEALDAERVQFRLTEGYPLDLDLPQINPFAVVGHGLGRSAEGLVTLNGTGPFRLTDHRWMSGARYERNDAYDGTRPRIDGFDYVVLPAGSDRDPVGAWALERGRIDVLIESWRPSIERDAARRLADSGEFQLAERRGSMVQLLCFNPGRAPFSEQPWRARVQQGVDRAALVARVEHGFADPVTTLFDPQLDDWPDARVGEWKDPGPAATPARCTMLVLESDASQVRLGIEVQRQLAPWGVQIEIAILSATERIERIESGDFDLYVHRTWGAPYDPHGTLYDRLGIRVPSRSEAAGGLAAQFVADRELQALVERSWRAPTTAERRAVYREIQGWIDEQAAIVPLYIPRRLALARQGVTGLDVGEDVYRTDFTKLDWDGGAR